MKKIADDVYSFSLKLPFPATPELSVYYLDGEKPAILESRGEMALENLAAEVYEEDQSNTLQQGAVLGYLAMLSRSGRVDAVLKEGDLYARIKSG